LGKPTITLHTFDIAFEVRFVGLARRSLLDGERFTQRIRAMDIDEAERHAKPLLTERLKREGVWGRFSLDWIGSSRVDR